MLTAVDQMDEARAVFSQALEANPLSADLRSDYASFLLWDGRYAEALENADLVMKLGASRFDRAHVWVTRATVALSEGKNTEALGAINRATFIDKNIFNMPVAVSMLHVLGEQAAASRMLDELERAFPDVSPDNPVLYIMLKPIDDILEKQRESGELSGPGSVSEIFRLLREND
jgi:Tfp pilus assembly protein PilF